ncbi:MAG: hypothetical protein AB7J28_15180 [Hyphomonadaceae bacterium]
MQQILDTQGLQAVGWRGFLDYPYLLEALAALLLATVLGALIAFHPAVTRTIDTAEEAELPKVSVMYALVGAIVGVVVLEYGLVVGFVVFGLGGLMRFRTDTASTRDTGRLIAVTLIGLIAGLNLPHFAVLAALFAWILIWVFERGPICTLEIEEAPKGRVKESAEAYRAALAQLGCKIVSENTSYAKNRIRFVLRAPAKGTHADLHAALCDRVPADLRGEIDWEVQ